MDNHLELTDQELVILTDIVRQHKINISVGDLSNFLKREQDTPLLNILNKLNDIWQSKKQSN